MLSFKKWPKKGNLSDQTWFHCTMFLLGMLNFYFMFCVDEAVVVQLVTTSYSTQLFYLLTLTEVYAII